ncbi:hypothetical protein SDC9_48149 [bioreactor metagenome]|uniref:Copper amine oxidase-like N-terminal domain-containing protein n=1 Tax=bioreactor metagenome TaxID=1076179 RepID=A0A644WE96_9ZZZZ
MKKIFSIILVMVMILSFGTTGASESPIIIHIDNQELSIPEEMGTPFVDKNGRTQVPVRVISEKLGKTVEWEQITTTVIVDNYIKIKVGEFTAEETPEGKIPKGYINMDSNPVILNGRTYVPIRFISEALGYTVEYEKVEGIAYVKIYTGSETNPIEQGADETTVIDGKEYGKNISDYTNEGGTISEDVIGSNTNSILGTRKEGSSLEDDAKLITKALEGTGYVIQNGSLQFPNSTGLADPNAQLKIRRDLNDNPVISIGGWPLDSSDKQFSTMKVLVNTALESAKYYSGSADDAKTIIDYFDNCVENGMNPEFDKTFTFGKTKVVFLDNIGYGVDIVILD